MDFWDKQNLPPCFAKDSCPYRGREICDYTCYNYHALQKLFEYSNLPQAFWWDKQLKPVDRDLENFRWLNDFKENIVSHVKQGHGLYLWSPNKGNGKTTWAAKIMIRYFESIASVFDQTRSRGVYVNVPEFIEELKDSFNEKDLTDEMLLLKERIKRADITIWDEIGGEVPKDWIGQLLYSLINSRYSNKKTQIFTSNCSLEELEARLGNDRITDRIYERCKPIRFYGESRRRTNSWWNTK